MDFIDSMLLYVHVCVYVYVHIAALSQLSFDEKKVKNNHFYRLRQYIKRTFKIS